VEQAFDGGVIEDLDGAVDYRAHYLVRDIDGPVN
jgi:hypothetical protein